MIMKLIKIFLTLAIIFSIQKVYANNIKIVYKINNEIITNQDIVNESRYLIAFNEKLKSLEKNKIYEIASRSIIQEKIKYLEIIKFFDLNANVKEVEKLINSNLINNLNFENVEQLDKFFFENKLDLNHVKFKVKVELFWSKLIYDKYISKVSVNKERFKNKILSEKNERTAEEFYLKEILFEIEENETLNSKYKQILNTVNTKDFDTAANIYSRSKTALKGGDIGWIKKSQLSEKVIKYLNNLSSGEISKPINMGSNFLILKLVEKRNINAVIDVDKELNLLIQKETDRQLNQYSTNFFNKIKKNIYINEL